MNLKSSALRVCLAAASLALIAPLAAQAQNIATVNGKPVPKSRVDALMQQAARTGQQQQTPDFEARVKEEVVLREVFMQEAERRGLGASPDYKAQMELARQSIMIRELFSDFQKKNPVTDADVQAEYEKFKSQSTGTEYHARHILVENEEEAKGIITQIKGGAKFEEVAKKSSKDPGSAENGGDLDFAKPEGYVPEFSQAMTKLKKGEMTESPVKTQFGFHVIKLEETREAQFPPLEEVKPQIQQRLAQVKLQAYQEKLRNAAKTDFKFSPPPPQQ
jgi:peptidyl-prolyl cis-trans isomerase C